MIALQPRHLSLALTAAVLAYASLADAHAGVVLPGQSERVNAGAPAEQWTVGEGATLVLQPGAVANRVQVSAGGQLIMNAASVDDAAGGVTLVGATATISRSTVNSSSTSVNGFALDLTTGAGNVASTATVSESTLRALTTAVRMAPNASLDLSATRVEAGVTGIYAFGGTLKIADGSHIEGGTHALRMRLGSSGHDVAAQVDIDGSTLVGTTGPAILVTGDSGAGASSEVYLSVSNGSQLIGGNGNVLEVSKLNATSIAPTAHLDVQGSDLNGNIVVAGDGSQAHVALSNGGSITGTFSNVSSATLDDGGRWQLTGNSDVGALTVNDGGVVALGDGTAFHTLSVDTFTGNGGTVVFNTVLGDDASRTDFLHVTGDTQGTAKVAVNNVGGAGAQTVNGIELIRVDGASDGQFDLAGRAVGGQYEYFLHKGGVAGGAGNWYLRSQLPTTPDPCEADPSLPGCTPIDPVDPVDPIDPQPVLRPEGGAYLANLTAAQNMFALGYHDRQAGQNGGRGWARVDGSRTGFDAVSRQLDVRGSSQALSVGADLLRGDGGSAFGVMLSSGNASSTSTNALTGYYARGKVKGEALGVYGTWRAAHADPYAGLYVDGSLQRAQFRNRVEGVALTPERYDSKAWQGAVEAGYALRLGGDASGGLFLEPQLQVGYNRWDNLRHTEANGTVVTTRDADGVFGRAGVRLSGVTRWGNGAADVQPYVAAHWLHQRSASSVLMDDEQVDARIPRSRGEFSAGASLKFAGGLGAWGGLSLQRGSGYHQTSAQVGVSYSW
ncbi:MAG TPA: autotransporter outer membrane beta-barrel domain-containing protein [Stenotrophomonas sp.]|nr:autotransporter outer membrane beta-barrel domain-containing protein [Stenotrophomonas sp.]